MVKQRKSVFSLLCPLTTLASLICGAFLAETLAQDKFLAGTYVGERFAVTFTKDGNYSVSENDKTVVKGTYTVTQDQIIFTDKEGAYACKETDTGKYKWKYDGKALTFSKVDDVCKGRIKGLTGQPLVKKQ